MIFQQYHATLVKMVKCYVSYSLHSISKLIVIVT